MRTLSPQLRSPSVDQSGRRPEVVAVPAVSEQVVGRRVQDEVAVVVMRYVQAPAGWWQDEKGRMQPPGAFPSPSQRVPPEADDVADGVSVPTPPTRGRFKKWTLALLPHRP